MLIQRPGDWKGRAGLNPARPSEFAQHVMRSVLIRCVAILAGGWDILIEMEEVSWVVLGLDCPQAVPGRARIGFPNALLALSAYEVDVGTRNAGIALPQRRSEGGKPGFLHN